MIEIGQVIILAGLTIMVATQEGGDGG